MRFKRLIIFIVVGILISLVILLFMNQNKKDEIKEDLPFLDEVEIEDDSIDVQTSEEDPPINNVKEFFVDTIKDTIDLFSNQTTHILAIGDSLTEGVGDSTDSGGYIGILDKSINKEKQQVEFTNYGRRGHRSEQLVKRLDDPDVSKEISKSDIILITIGANDIMQVFKENFTNLTIEPFIEERVLFESRLNNMLSKMHKINPTSKIYLVGIYNPFKEYFDDIKELDEIVDEWNQTGQTVTSNYENTEFIPVKDIFDYSDEELFSDDNFHPNNLGYERMAERVLDYLRNEERKANDK